MKLGTSMKRYLVFAFDNYYPSGGWSDMRGAFDDLQDARKLKQEILSHSSSWFNGGPYYDNAEIVDLETMTKVKDEEVPAC